MAFHTVAQTRVAAKRPHLVLDVDVLIRTCSLRPNGPVEQHAPRTCWWCAGPLPPRRQHWCSTEHAEAWHGNHWFNQGRHLAFERDEVWTIATTEQEFWADRTYTKVVRGRRGERLGIACEGCGIVTYTGNLEVNHRERAEGTHAIASCRHHLDNLQVLCRPCHREVTAAQLAADAAVRRADRQTAHSAANPRLI